MRWLEEPSDEGERLVREGLDLAARRTDELALRRIWSRLVDSQPRETRRRWPFLMGGGALALAGGMAVLVTVIWPLFHDVELDAPYPVATHELFPAAPPQIADPLPVLLGPATVRTGVREARSVRLKGGARLDLGSETTLAIDAGQRPALERGRVGLEVPHQQPGEVFTVVAGPYVIVVVGTKFEVGVGKRQVQVDVREGVVEVWRDGEMVRLTAGKSWKGPVPELAPRPHREARIETAPAPRVEPSPSERFASAKAAIASGDTAAALSILRDLAQGDGPTAENSSYEIGRVLRDLRAQPREALNVWSSYRTRFPRGLLRMEADVSIVETLLELGDRRSALVEAKAFLERHPRSERRGEMARLVEQLQRLSEDDGSSARASR